MYTLERLLEDASRAKGAATKRGGGDLQSVWDALNRYVTAIMEKRGTLSVASFCKIGWRVEEHAQGKAKLRPHFQVAESFVRSYNVDVKAVPPVADRMLAAIEEFNFSKAAIRYTQNLTKDGLFIGLRAILHQLGEVVASGQSLSIDFEVGRLLCSERAMTFAFAADLYLREGLEVPTGSLQDSQYRPSATFVAPSKDALTLNLAGSNRFATTIKAHSGFLGGGWAEGDGPRPSPRLREEDAFSEGGETEVTTYPASLPSDASATEKAQHEALDRHITQIGVEAAAAIAERDNWEDHLQRCVDEERRGLELRRAVAREHAGQLKDQMRQAEQRRTEGRQHLIEQASQHDFPNFSEVPEREVFEYVQERRNHLKEDLDQQVDTKQRLKLAAKQREREQEATSVEATRKEMALVRLEAAVKREQDKAALQQSWEKDKRLHTVRRAIEEHQKAPPAKSNLTALMSPGAAPGGHLGFGAMASPRSELGSPGASRPPTGAVRRMPFGAAASLALQREKLGSSLRR